MALVKNKYTGDIICLDRSQESGAILDSEVYYNYGVITTFKDMQKYYGHLVKDLSEEGLLGIHFDQSNGAILMYETTTIWLANFDEVVKIDHVINSSCYRKFYNNKIICYPRGIAYVDEDLGYLIVIKNGKTRLHKLPEYDIILNLTYNKYKSKILLAYIHKETIIIFDRHFERESTYIIRDLGKFKYVCISDYICSVIDRNIVYNIGFYNKYMGRIVDIFGNLIFMLDDGKYYYAESQYSAELTEIDTETYIPYEESVIALKSARNI
jgi:hypothetical protein